MQIQRKKSPAELEAGLEEIRRSPRQEGTLEMIVRRPATDQREVVASAQLETTAGLVGDNWLLRGSSSTPDGEANPLEQLTLINTRLIGLLTESRDQWPLAGDQLYVDFDLSIDNVPPGTRLQIGSAVIEATTQPHTGCSKFIDRFGADAQRFIHSPVGRQMQLRGINARIITTGTIQVGDRVRKL